MPHHSRRSFVRVSGAVAGVAAGLAALGLGGRASAQGTTLDVTRIVTGFPPGGTSDTLCRRVAEGLRGGAFARTAVVENKAGAGGQIAVQAMKGGGGRRQRAAADAGLDADDLSAHLQEARLQRLHRRDAGHARLRLRIRPSRRAGLAVGPAVPAAVKAVPDFLAWYKANPVDANFGSPAAGSVPHFIGALLGRSAGIELKHVAYRGSQPAIQDMIAGQLQAVSAPIDEFLQQVAAGKARLLGVSSVKRSRFTPRVPTYGEQGLKDMVFSEWFGFFLPGGADVPVVLRANRALRAALAARDVVDGLAVMGLETLSSTPEELAIHLKADHDRWGPIVRKIGFTANS